ncbi:MAG: hypothetical protein ACI8RD_008029, partial [Bacillariaceae sp.]
GLSFECNYYVASLSLVASKFRITAAIKYCQFKNSVSFVSSNVSFFSLWITKVFDGTIRSRDDNFIAKYNNFSQAKNGNIYEERLMLPPPQYQSYYLDFRLLSALSTSWIMRSGVNF